LPHEAASWGGDHRADSETSSKPNITERRRFAGSSADC
jgi:hypothetical protein